MHTTNFHRKSIIVAGENVGSFAYSTTNIQKQFKLSNIIHYICAIKSYQRMKLNRIKTVLSEKGISQTWLAKQLDKSFSMVNAYACNRIQPNLETLQQIAEILQVDLKDLITDKKERLQ